MQAYMHPQTAAALLAKSREFTQPRREKREKAEEYQRVLAWYERHGWQGRAAQECAHFHVYGEHL